MKRKNMARNALFTSIISLLLCVSMLVGTTFAWFTDEVTTGMNTIAAGNLDVELLANGSPVNSSTTLFDDVTRWEPGVVVYENLQIANVGTLALNYQLSLNFGNENDLNGHKLSEVLQVAIIDKIADGATRADVLAAAKVSGNAGVLSSFLRSGELAAGASTDEQTVVIYWEPNDNATDNLYNANNGQSTSDGEPLHIEFGVNLYATQKMSEEDSFGNDYDENAEIPDDMVLVRSEEELIAALEGDKPIFVAESFGISKTINITKNTVISGNGAVLSRADGFTGTMFNANAGATLKAGRVTLDGGAVWNGRASGTNSGVVATGNLIATTGNGSIVLESGAVLQNNDGANAISLAKLGGGSLTVNGASIINNRSAAGAIWGGGNITINSGKINGNHATSIGGAIRMLDGNNNVTFTMNGGEMNYNTSDGTGGAIWGGNRAKYYLNGGEMAYNSAASAGGAIWSGTYESYYISGNFKLHDNTAGELGGAIRFSDHASLTMTGGQIYNNTINGESDAFFLYNNSATITGGTVSDNFSYSGGLGLTVGEANITGVIHYNLGTNHKTAYLATSFNSFKFTVEESHVSLFNFKPAEGYTYTAGDEAKLICMNEGYETYWDATTGTFRLQATN